MQTDRIDERVVRTLVSSPVPVAIFSWRPWAEEGWPVEFVSPNVAHVLGYTPEDFLSGRIVYSQIIHPDDLARVTCEVREHTASGETFWEHEDYRIVDPSGRVRWVRDVTAVYRDNGLSRYFGFIVESTAQHEALEALALAKREAEAATHAKTEFMSMVSHELRTPLTLILAPVETLLEGGAGPLPEGARRAVRRIERNAERLAALVDDLLAFARVEEGRAEVHWAEVEAGALLAGLIDEARAEAAARGVELRLDASAAPGAITTDPEMLERIALNLVSNGLKFTPAGGRVQVFARVDPEAFVLEVADTGPGIPAEHQERIWRRFERLEPAPAGRGVGLGLALVRAFAELMGGAAGVESEVGRGSRFWVRLPSRPPPDEHGPTAARPRLPRFFGADAPVTPSVQPHPAPRPRVLVADDSADMRALLLEILAESFDVEAVSDGAQALEAVRRSPPDVVLCDVLMPVVDGLEVVRRLKADPDLQNIPVILVTARAGRQEIVAGLGAGADDYLAKPFEPTELRARVQAAARLRRDFLELTRKHQELEAAHHLLGEVQEQLVQSAKLAAIGQFTAGISHELNNPLATVLLHAHSLLRQLPEGPARASVQVVLDAAERCRRVMRTILDHARAGPRQTAAVPVPSLLDAVGTLARAQARSRDVVVQVEPPPLDLPEVEVAAHQIEAALLNVVSNALDATPPGGRVYLGAAACTRESSPGVEITVTDTGCGIPPDVLPLVFEPFFTTKAAGRGTGLGLSLARRMVQDSGGTIDAESEVDLGTRVRVWLPAVQR